MRRFAVTSPGGAANCGRQPGVAAIRGLQPIGRRFDAAAPHRDRAFCNIGDGARIHARRAAWGARGEVGLTGPGFAARWPHGVAGVRLRAGDGSGPRGRDRLGAALALTGGALLALTGSGCAFGSPSHAGGVRGASTTATPSEPGGVTAVTPAGSIPGAATPEAGPAASLSLRGVACVATAYCWAVGSSTVDTGQPETLVAEDTGAGWRLVIIPPVPGTTGSELDAVTCAGDGSCWAVGDSWQGSGSSRSSQPLIERETPAGGWSVVSSPAPSGAQESVLDGVACAAGGACWAVGYSSTSSAAGARSETLIEQESATGWTIVASPVLTVSGAGGQLAGVACAAAECWAVGHWDNAAGTPQALIEESAGGAWTVVPGPGATPTPGRAATRSGTPLPARAAATPGSLLSSVTCVGQSTCWAAGSTVAAGGASQGLLQEYEGSVWISVPAPSSGSQLLGVACSAAGACWAVGDSTAAGSGTLIEQETAGGWSIVPSTNPGATTDPQLNGVACTGNGECWAVGGPAPPSGSGSMILEQMVGGAA